MPSAEADSVSCSRFPRTYVRGYFCSAAARLGIASGSAYFTKNTAFNRSVLETFNRYQPDAFNRWQPEAINGYQPDASMLAARRIQCSQPKAFKRSQPEAFNR